MGDQTHGESHRHSISGKCLTNWFTVVAFVKRYENYSVIVELG